MSPSSPRRDTLVSRYLLATLRSRTLILPVHPCSSWCQGGGKAMLKGPSRSLYRTLGAILALFQFGASCSTSREVRRLDSASLAPVYTSFAEVSDAAPCVRGFGLQDLFYRKHVSFVRSYQRASLSGCAAGVWLGEAIQMNLSQALNALLITTYTT